MRRRVVGVGSELRVRGLGWWWAGSLASLAVALWALGSADPGAFSSTWGAAVAAPLSLAAAVGLYAAAFALRAWVWTRVVPALSFGMAWSAIHVSLGANHILPLRLGEILRVTTAVGRGGIPAGTATASTVVLRAADVVAVAALAALLGPRLVDDLLGGLAWLPLAAAAAVGVAGIVWLRRTAANRLSREASDAADTADTSVMSVMSDARPRRGARVALLAAGAALAGWVLESAVVWQAAHWAGIELTAGDAILVTAVTIAAQVFAVAPAGLGTYEAAAMAALVGLGAAAEPALAAALTAHAVKTAYSLATGAIALFVPAPGAFGRLRLDRVLPPRPPRRPVPDSAPLVLFLPAHDEIEAVADVVRRAPDGVCGHPVVVLVIDDGSTDGTADAARAAGATVVSLGRNRGLGAAVRRGFAEAVAQRPAAVAFCDADGEYAPEELPALVAPVLTGEADYVVGSRFAGRIHRMLPHRRLGNVVLTKLLAFVARRPISDGQSGYRALSADAATAAEVVHDYNYAQVLTLDLLAKGYAYAEVPISYSFRTTGRTFVKLGRYLRKVVPGVHRELNAPARPTEPVLSPRRRGSGTTPSRDATAVR